MSAVEPLEKVPGRVDGARYLEATLGVPFREGNRITVLENGRGTFPAMLEEIESAQHEINFVTFVYWTGAIAVRFARALAARARDGLQVRVLLDAFGAARIDHALIEQMESAGVELRWFRPIARWKLWQCDNRTHRKILVCDHAVGFTGGTGIAEEWEGDARDPSEWRDIHVRIEGPAVDGLNGAFWNDWLETTGYREAAPSPRMPATADPGTVRTLVLRSTATPNGSENAMLISSLLAMAEERIYFATAYFVPDESFVELLGRTAQRGVDVRIMMPGPHTDSRFDRWASEASYETLLSQGVRIFRYQTTMLHAKYCVVDDRVSVVGSTNFNQRSLKKDNEVSAVFDDREINERFCKVWNEDSSACEEVQDDRWARRGLLQRARESLTTPFRRQL